MKITIVDRRKVLHDFNERNGTTNDSSRYIGCCVIDNNTPEARIVFSHTNGVGRAVSPLGVQLRGTRINDCYLD